MKRTILIAVVALSAGACSSGGGGNATATFEPRSGSQVTGTATFTAKDGKTEIVVQAKSLAPGKHGVNVHEKGDCTGANASAVGPRFNPPNTKKAGVLGDLEVGADGSGTLKVTSDALTVGSGEKSVVGRSIVISSDPENPASEVTFGIVSCGVIQQQ